MANNTAAGNQQQAQAVCKPSAGKHGNVLPLWGNEKTMNLNPMILTNVLSSPYFKVQLYELKTYHEVVDEIYFKVNHVEPWEKGSRKTAGQTGMCGGVRGVGTGGIVSTAFCLLYKLFTLKLTRKQVMGLITHSDSPYIRALGFMYIRYTQPPPDLVDWYDGFLDDEEELDVKAGGGCVMTVGEMLRSFLTKLEWFSTLFPRIPVPVQKMIDQQMKARPRKVPQNEGKVEEEEDEEEEETGGEDLGRPGVERRRSRSPRRTPSPRRSPKRSRSRSHHRDRHGATFDNELERERERQKKERGGGERDRGGGERGGDRDRIRERRHSASRERRGDRKEKEREKEKDGVGENDRSKRKDRDHHKGSDRERSRDKRSRGETEEKRGHKEEREDRGGHKEEREDRGGHKEEREDRGGHKDEREDRGGRHREERKAKRSTKSRSKERRHKAERGEEKREEKSRKKEKERERSSPKGEGEGEPRAHKHSVSKERHRQRDNGKESGRHVERERGEKTTHGSRADSP